MTRRAAGAALLLAVAACGGSGRGGEATRAPAPPPVEVPARSATSGDRLLAFAPAGADALLEIDLARLRGNEQVGALVRAVTGPGAELAGQGGTADLVSGSDQLLFVSYEVGGAEPAQLVLAAGPQAARIAGAEPVADGVVAIGPPALVARARRVASGGEPPLSEERPLLRARAMAMPAEAQGASLRMAAHLEFDARVALARELELDAVPAWMSVWLDVADDLAGVALLGGDDDATPERLAAAADRLRKRIEAAPSFRRAGLAALAGAVTIEARATDARIVLVVGPRRLAQLVERVMARLGGS